MKPSLQDQPFLQLDDESYGELKKNNDVLYKLYELIVHASTVYYNILYKPHL